jgi:excisionase family DNA binding protein
MSVGTLAAALGVSRQRLYSMIHQGKIKTVPMAGGSVIMPQEVDRVMASALRVNIKGHERLRFDFSAI